MSGSPKQPRIEVKDLPSKLEYLKTKLPELPGHDGDKQTDDDLCRNLRLLTSDRLGSVVTNYCKL